MNSKLISLDGVKRQAFRGYEYKKTDIGTKGYQFNFPHDDSRYECQLELYAVEKDKKGHYVLKNRVNPNGDYVAKPIDSIKLSSKGTTIDLGETYKELRAGQPFAYRFKLIEKSNRKETYAIDPGAVLYDSASKSNPNLKFNIVTQHKGEVFNGGSALLSLPDSYNVGWVYDKNGNLVLDNEKQQKAYNATKTFANHMGGTIAGYEAKIPELEKQGYSKLVGTPLFTGDNVSSHCYWNKNCMQIAPQLGNINNFRSFQEKMFKAGKSFVSDGAFVNEGLAGIHFKHMLKNDDSEYKYWFRASNIDSAPAAMGVLGKNRDFVDHKIVNSPYTYTESNGQIKIGKNPKYDNKKPTYIQVFDSRCVTDAEKKDTTKLIESYSKTNTDNPLDINTHNDTVILYPFEINPKTLNTNIKRMNEYNKNLPADKQVKMHSPLGLKMLSSFEKFNIEEKFESGFETWDANTDIAKLNFTLSNADLKRVESLPKNERDIEITKMKRGNYQARDYVVSSGRFFTKLTSDIHKEYVTRSLKDVKGSAKEILNNINGLIGKDLPKKLEGRVNESVVQNVLDKNYNLSIFKKTSNYNDLLMESLMELPLDSIEFADDTVAVIGSPFITKRATEKEQVGQTRFTALKEGNKHLYDEISSVYKKADSLYTEELKTFADGMFKKLNNVMPESKKLINKDGKVTDYGKYVIPMLAPSIVKFAMVKAVAPNSEVRVNEKNGDIIYDYDKLRNETTLPSMGIYGTSSKDEASRLVSKIKTGVTRIDEKSKNQLFDSLTKRIEGTNENSFAIAEMLVDRSGLALDWRIDAAKDIADIDALRNGIETFRDTWDDVIEFWGTFNKAVLDENKNSYVMAEVTDEYTLFDLTNDNSGKYWDAKDAVMQLHQDAGMSSIANYSYFFTQVATLFNKKLENGEAISPDEKEKVIFKKLVSNGERFLRSAPLDSLRYSYTFIGNHDKPRMLHGIALDMGLFHSDLKNPNNEGYRRIAAAILNEKATFDHTLENDVQRTDFNVVNPKAIAMAIALRDGFDKSIEETNIPQDRKTEIRKAVYASIKDLATGSHLGKTFSADAFGTKPIDTSIDIVLKQAKEVHKLESKDGDFEKIGNSTFENILKPAMTKLNGMMKYLVALPGVPTLYAGDDLGMTGYEEKTKNVYLQNRNALRWDWLENDNKAFVKEFYNNITETMSLRGRKELAPLNTGTPHVLSMIPTVEDDKLKVTPVLRQNSDGAMTISLLNPNGIDFDNKAFVNEDTCSVNIDSISFHTDDLNKDSYELALIGLKGGLKAGTVFKNADESDKNLYIVCEDKGGYFIKRFDDMADYNRFKNSTDDSKWKNREINIKDNVMILYHQPNRVVNAQHTVAPAAAYAAQSEAQVEKKELAAV